MARPKRDSEAVPARARLEHAFWELLAEAPYKDMTIGSLSRRAGVNHNTFYYYFDNLDDMAVRLLEANLIPEFPERVLAAFGAGALDFADATGDARIRLRFQRLCLLAGPNSATWLTERLSQAIRGLWLASLGLDPADLTRAEAAALTFMLGGMLAVLGEFGQDGDPAVLGLIVDSPLGRGLMTTMQTMAGKGAART